MRKLVYAVILIFTAIFVFNHLEELRLIVEVYKQGDWHWMLAAVCAQLLWLVIIAAAFQSTYRLVGIRERLSRLIPLTTAANFINVVAPSYGLGAMAVLIADGRQRGKPAAKVSTAAILYLVYDYLGFMIVLPVGLFIFSKYDLLNPVLIAASVFAAGIGLALIALTVLGIYSTDKLSRALIRLSEFANRSLYPILKRDLIPTEKALAFAKDISDGLHHVRRSPLGLLVPGILALMRKAAMMLILYLVSWAFNYPFNLDTLIAGFCASYLFTIASITPSGVGFVEGAMMVYISGMGVPLETTAAISFAYRGITLWLVLIYGMIVIRWVGHSPKDLGKTNAVAEDPGLIDSPSTLGPMTGTANPIPSPNPAITDVDRPTDSG